MRRDANGVHVVLSELNFVTSTAVALQSIDLAPQAGDDQIVLRLAYDPAHAGVVTGSFDLVDNGVVQSTTTFTPGTAAHIFDNGNWTQAQFLANGVPENISNVLGTYNSFSIDQNGNWTDLTRNGSAATQALAEGQTVTENFQVQATDSGGAS